MRYSPEYQAILKTMHETTKWGGDGHWHADNIAFFARTMEAKTMLDYGCGRGTLRNRLLSNPYQMEISEYDPGIKGKEKEPKPADLVVCTDVLEHVELGSIGFVLKHINDLSKKGAYLVISCRPANSILPDGRNAHLIVKAPDWWMIKLEEYFPKAIITTKTHPKELRAWIRKT